MHTYVYVTHSCCVKTRVLFGRIGRISKVLDDLEIVECVLAANRTVCSFCALRMLSLQSAETAYRTLGGAHVGVHAYYRLTYVIETWPRRE